MFKARRGFLIIEYLAAITLFAIVTLAFLPWFQQSGKLGKEIAHEVTAKNIAQGILEKMLVDFYSNVTTDNYPDSEITYYIDDILDIGATVEITITGDGYSDNSSGSSSLADPNAAWETDQWIGSTVLIVGGNGQGQRAYITGNTSTVLNITTDLSGATSQSWDTNPDASSHYVINGGKTIDITVRWNYMGKPYQRTLKGLVPFYASGA